jgi:hypothetical protein
LIKNINADVSWEELSAAKLSIEPIRSISSDLVPTHGNVYSCKKAMTYKFEDLLTLPDWFTYVFVMTGLGGDVLLPPSHIYLQCGRKIPALV